MFHSIITYLMTYQCLLLLIHISVANEQHSKTWRIIIKFTHLKFFFTNFLLHKNLCILTVSLWRYICPSLKKKWIHLSFLAQFVSFKCEDIRTVGFCLSSQPRYRNVGGSSMTSKLNLEWLKSPKSANKIITKTLLSPVL